MGRYSTGALQTSEAKRIDLSFLLKMGYIQKGQVRKASLYWSVRGECIGNISIESCYNGQEIWLRLMYSIKFKETEEKKEYDYKIYLEAVPSNLGKGEVLYFICPVSGRRCRILYKAYGYDRWKSREAYQNRLYYSGQICSKYSRDNQRFFRTEEVLENLEKMRPTTTYKGKPTKRAIRMELLEHKHYYLDIKRLSTENMPLKLRPWFKW